LVSVCSVYVLAHGCSLSLLSVSAVGCQGSFVMMR
jgi:hypothetical protein